MNRSKILKNLVPNLLVLVVIILVYSFLSLPSQWYLRALPAVIVVFVFSIIKNKKPKTFKQRVKSLITSYIVLTIIFYLFSISKGLGIIFGLLVIVGLAGYRIWIDTRNEESIYLDSIREIETTIWGEPLDPIKKRKQRKGINNNE